MVRIQTAIVHHHPSTICKHIAEDNRLLIRRLKQSLAPKRPRDTAPLLRPKLASGATPLHNAEGWDSEDEEPPPTPSSAEPDTLRAARAMAHAPTISASRGGPAEQVARRAPRLVHKTVASGAARRQARSRTQLLSVGAEDGDSLDADEEVVAGAADAAQADVAAAHAQYAALLEDDDIIGLGTLKRSCFDGFFPQQHNVTASQQQRRLQHRQRPRHPAPAPPRPACAAASPGPCLHLWRTLTRMIMPCRQRSMHLPWSFQTGTHAPRSLRRGALLL